MEIWIRTQDRECLMKVDRLDYDLSLGEHRIMVNGYQTLVGKYNTQARALEVLDDISSKIKNQFIVKVKGLWRPKDIERMKDSLIKDYNGEFIMETQPLDIKPINLNLIYYEMPKE